MAYGCQCTLSDPSLNLKGAAPTIVEENDIIEFPYTSSADVTVTFAARGAEISVLTSRLAVKARYAVEINTQAGWRRETGSSRALSSRRGEIQTKGGQPFNTIDCHPARKVTFPDEGTVSLTLEDTTLSDLRDRTARLQEDIRIVVMIKGRITYDSGAFNTKACTPESKTGKDDTNLFITYNKATHTFNSVWQPLGS